MQRYNLNSVLLVAIMVATMQFYGTVAQKRHVVGDGLGWAIPSGGAVAYTTWASLQTFTVDDLLVFTFTDGQHDVAEISAPAFGSCTATNPISLTTNGPATLTLTTPGMHYYICTFRSHCQIGQKLAINVSASDTTTSTPPPATPRTPRSPPPPSTILRTPPSPSTTTPSTPPPSETPTTPSPPCPPNVSSSSCQSSPPTTTWDDTTPPPPPPSDDASSLTTLVPATFLIMGLAFLNY